MNIRYHRVKRGETLSSISNLYYKTDEYALVIFQHNRAYIYNPNEIYSGQQLAIPYLPELDQIKQLVSALVS